MAPISTEAVLPSTVAHLITQFQAMCYAHALGRRFPSDSPEKLAGALVHAQVDLNQHQVEAALFVYQPQPRSLPP